MRSPLLEALDSYNIHWKRLHAAQRRAPFAESLEVSLISVTREMVLNWLAGVLIYPRLNRYSH
jgi:hypothetical protein